MVSYSLGVHIEPWNTSKQLIPFMPCNSETCLLEFDVLVQYFHKLLVKMRKFNTAPLWNGCIYLWTLLHGVTGSKNNEYTWHFETEISGSKNQEISWSDKEFPIEDQILTAMLVKTEVSYMSYPRRYGSSTVNSLSKKHKTQSIFMTSFATSCTCSTARGGSWLSGLH